MNRYHKGLGVVSVDCLAPKDMLELQLLLVYLMNTSGISRVYFVNQDGLVYIHLFFTLDQSLIVCLDQAE